MRQRFEGEQKCQLMKTSLCHQCSFDELLEEQFDFFLAPERPRVQEVFGISVPTSNFLHRGHTWVALENAGRVRIGLDDFCQKVLGPADCISLPQVGEEIHDDQVALTLSRQGKKARGPGAPKRRHRGGQSQGPAAPQPGARRPLRRGLAVAGHSHQSEARPGKDAFWPVQCRLDRTRVPPAAGDAGILHGDHPASGGGIIDDVFGHYPQLGWQRLVQEFLHTALRVGCSHPEKGNNQPAWFGAIGIRPGFPGPGS